VTSDSSSNSPLSENEIHSDEEFYDLPSPAEDGEITEEKVEFSEENFHKISRGMLFFIN
jgi:hypothetical protein